MPFLSVGVRFSSKDILTNLSVAKALKRRDDAGEHIIRRGRRPSSCNDTASAVNSSFLKLPFPNPYILLDHSAEDSFPFRSLVITNAKAKAVRPADSLATINAGMAAGFQPPVKAR